ncbi:MAG: 4-(cytidine 5'-diphospho)-2-C-methyl-D-erythritol kinase [Bacteroidota bacterium]|nr:4-(cytidine 5'-diphospho)-2-C-methyl-D-erythritol kinase [Bacteroidota bacterium]
MVNFPNAKINLGLNIIEKRQDGFHNIETVFYPIDWCDSVEVIENKKYRTGDLSCDLSLSGLIVDGNSQDNLIVKAFNLLRLRNEIPPIKVYLHKVIPMGAGLGGGSSDAAFFMKLLNQQFELKISDSNLKLEAAKLGSDCAFFVENKPVYAKGKGDEFSSIDVSLKDYKIVVVYPNIHSNTQLAYSRVIPKKPRYELKDIVLKGPLSWREKLTNDFEDSIFHHFPEIKELKQLLYNHEAIYSSLSGSGSSVFGIFKSNQLVNLQLPPHYRSFESSAE